MGFQRLQELLKWSRVQVCIERACPENLSRTFSAQYVVDRFYTQSPSMLKALFHHQSKGSVVLSRLTWCETVLQRFPSELLSEEDLLEGRFCLAKGTFQVRLKRVGDVVVAVGLLLVTSPLIFLSALLIKLRIEAPFFILRSGLV